MATKKEGGGKAKVLKVVQAEAQQVVAASLPVQAEVAVVKQVVERVIRVMQTRHPLPTLPVQVKAKQAADQLKSKAVLPC